MNDAIVRELRIEWDAALSALKIVLDERPGEHLAEISQAVNALVNVRDRLIELRRTQGLSQDATHHLDEINAMISVVASLEYPLAGLRWQRLELVHDGLEQMLKDSSHVT